MEDVQNAEALARERVARLVENWDWPEPQILEDIVALGEAAIPAIEAVLTPELLRFAETDEAADSFVYYARGILGDLPTPKAIPLLVNLFSQVDDDMIDSLPDAVYPHGPAAIPALLTVTADSTLRCYPRTLAAEIAVNLAGQDAALRAQIADTLRPQLAAYLGRAEPLTDDDTEVVSWFADNLAELADPDARPLIEAAFEADLIDTDIVDQEFLREAYGVGVEAHLPQPAPFLEEYRRDFRRHERDLRTGRVPTPLFPAWEDKPETVVLGRRLGRNEPCWCGSGKKYKKCHLVEDEKAGR